MLDTTYYLLLLGRIHKRLRAAAESEAIIWPETTANRPQRLCRKK